MNEIIHDRIQIVYFKSAILVLICVFPNNVGILSNCLYIFRIVSNCFFGKFFWSVKIFIKGLGLKNLIPPNQVFTMYHGVKFILDGFSSGRV